MTDGAKPYNPPRVEDSQPVGEVTVGTLTEGSDGEKEFAWEDLDLRIGPASDPPPDQAPTNPGGRR